MPEKFFLQISVCFLLSNDPHNITTKQLLLSVYGSKVIAVPARGPSVNRTPLTYHLPNIPQSIGDLCEYERRCFEASLLT